MMTRKGGSQRKNHPHSAMNNISLIMESGNPPLSEIQLSVKNKSEEEFKSFMKKMNETIVKKNGEIIEQGTHITVYEIDCTPNFPVSLISKDVTNVCNSSGNILKSASGSTLLTTSQANVQSLISNNGVLLPSGSVASSGSNVFSGQTTYQLVVGPRMGLIVTPSSAGSATTIAPSTLANAVTTALPNTRPTTTARVQLRPSLGSVNQPPKRYPAPAGTGKLIINPVTQKNTSSPMLTRQAPTATVSSGNIPKIITASVTSKVVPTSVNLKTSTTTAAPPNSSTINTRSKGKVTRSSGLNSSIETSGTPTSNKTNTTKSSNAVVDLTDDDSKTNADSRELTINRYPGRIYPSLAVVARPHLKVKELTSSVITAERTQLDTKVKGILTNSPTKFTEWLIQQGLIRSEQLCTIHVGPDSTPFKLKLGMYSDVSKFPHSGGYVWISDCCPQKFVSVFCHSIFEGASHPPTVLLKLMYHWSCQTNVHNIISWVKVENLDIKNFFTNLRAVCTAAVSEKFGKMGGVGKKVEVGVISLGTTSQNGSVRQVKVEVLGIMDPVTKFVRLRAVDPVQNADKNHKLRFTKILQPLGMWVHKSTTIVTDYTVDKATLNEMGFSSVYQVQLNTPQTAKDGNHAIMDYLKRVVPRMFQNTLSLLSRSIIQQFLDELVWRERWGPIASKAFDNLILHLSEITKLETGDTLVNRLKSITANPFRDWSYKNWKAAPQSTKKPVHESADADGASKSNSAKTSITNVKSTTLPAGGKSSKQAKGNSSVSLTIDDSSDEASNTASSTDRSAATDIDEDSNSAWSTSSSRRSRNRVTLNEEPSLKSLEPFYYGTLPPDVMVLNKLRKVELNMKCFVCGLTYNNNIQFMKHLAGHAQDEGAFTTDYQCKYCLKNCTSAYDLEDHLGSTHLPSKYNSMCLICSARFSSREALINHMQDTHVELELPYNCTICKFRCSEHTKIVDHFYEVHDGGEKVQCPFCLKVVAFENTAKVKLTQNVNFLLNHIKRHQQKRKCPKCILTFVNKTLLKEHLSQDHQTCIAIPGVIRHQSTELTTTLMPSPPLNGSLNRKAKQSSLVSKFSVYNFDDLCFPDTLPGKCLECKNSDSADNHFTSYLQCMKCIYASCCKVAMKKHIATMHEAKRNRKVSYKKTIPLAKPLYCVCGFSASCGNTMASHLVHCKRRIAYSNPERASQYAVQMQSASFPALVNLDEVEQDPNDASDKWLRAFVKNSDAKNSDSSQADDKTKRPAIHERSPPRMLKELGLVRKESTSNETEEDPASASDVANSEQDNSSTPINTEPSEFTGNNGRKRSIAEADDNEEISSAVEDVEKNSDEPKIKQKKLDRDERSDIPSDESTVKDPADDKISSVVAEKIVDATSNADQTDDVTSTEFEDEQSALKSVDSGDTGKETGENIHENDKQTEENIHENDKLTEENIHENDKLTEENIHENDKQTEENIHENDKPTEGNIHENDKQTEKNIHENDKLTEENILENDKHLEPEKEVAAETVAKKLSSSDSAAGDSEKADVAEVEKNIDESVAMETEEAHSVSDKIDDTAENSVPMECEDDPGNSGTSVDTDSAQDKMMVD